jgi:hypothetical protein
MFIDYLRNCFMEKLRNMWIYTIIIINNLYSDTYSDTCERKDSNDYIPLKRNDYIPLKRNDLNYYNDIIDECNFHNDISDKCNTCEQNITNFHKTHRLFDKSYCSINCRNSSSELLNI